MGNVSYKGAVDKARQEKLRYLNLSGNRISKIEGKIDSMPDLYELDLSRNLLGTLPAELSLVPNLRVFMLQVPLFSHILGKSSR